MNLRVDTTCSSCNRTFCCEAREDSERSIEGHSFRGAPQPLDEYCPSCAELSGDVPPSPCCDQDGGKLRGSSEGVFECSECGRIFAVSTIRALALGHAAARIVCEGPDDPASIGRLVLRAARGMGVIP